MNERSPGIFKSIWEKSWNEPRHFFFWLALLSPVVFIMVVVMTGLAGNPPPLVHWFALAALVGFILGVPGFVLSWIPPVRRLFARMLQRKLFVLACLVTLFALFYAEENWRGRSAWNNFRREWEPRGVQFELEKIVPPAVPDDQNFAAAPLFKELCNEFDPAWQRAHTGPNGVTNTMDRLQFKFRREKQDDPINASGNLLYGQRTDLNVWQDYYRNPTLSPSVPWATNEAFRRRYGLESPPSAVEVEREMTHEFPIAPQPQSPAADVLLALSKYDGIVEELRTASLRPNSRFPIRYEDGFSALLPHLDRLKGINLFLDLRTVAELEAGQTNKAADDVMLSLRVANLVRGESLLISQLVRLAQLQVSLNPIWEGLADHRWSDAQLVAIENELGKVDLLADYQTGMNGERVFGIWTVDLISRTRDLNFLDLPGPETPGLGNQIEAAANNIFFRLIPRGWFDQNKVALGRMHVEFIRPLVDQEKQLVSPENSRRTSAAVQAKAFRPTPYNWFTGMLIPALDKAAKKFAIGQTYVNLARVACALERYRLAHDSYPETLDALKPQFITRLPHDVINGQPLTYRRNADGSFILYSVGWNETDEGGAVAFAKGKNSRVDQDKGDWVWRYPTN